MERVRECEPPPHVIEHAPQLLHCDTAQLTGHGPRSHCAVSDVTPHGLPPWAGCVWMLRVRDWVPISHVTEHSVQAVHAEVAHATGHASELHARV